MGYLQGKKGCRKVVLIVGYWNFRRSRYMQVSERLGGDDVTRRLPRPEI